MHTIFMRGLAIAAGSLLVATSAVAQVSAPLPIPEPASLSILAVGVAGLAWIAARKRRK